MPIGITRADATLRRAARFLIMDRYAATPSCRSPSKVMGNALRELDRFLSILIDEVAAAAEIDDDLVATLRSRRNTANKLRMLQGLLGHGSPDHARLRALGRSRDCLFYCAGLVRRADRRAGSSMTAGWPARAADAGGGLMIWPVGSRLRIEQADIEDICRFYNRIADELLLIAERSTDVTGADGIGSVVFSRDPPYVAFAIVACDGL